MVNCSYEFQESNKSNHQPNPVSSRLTRDNIVAYTTVAGHRPRKKQRVRPLLCKRRINRRPFLGNGSVNTPTIEKLLKAVFSVGSASRVYNEDTGPAERINERELRVRISVKLCKGGWEGTALRLVDSWGNWEEFCKGGCAKGTWERGAEESQLLQAVARERLLKTQQAGKYLTDAVVNCKVWRTVIPLQLLVVPSGVNKSNIQSIPRL
jgi:hypothetical protein